MVKSIKQLKREIASQRTRIAKEENISKQIGERQELSSELFKLKNRKLIGAGAKAKRLSKKFGKGLLKVGSKAVPIIKKQAKLIREQQLRDDALARERAKKKIPTTKVTKTTTKFVPIKGKGKKKLFKKVKSRIKFPKAKPINKKPSDDIFGNLDF